MEEDFGRGLMEEEEMAESSEAYEEVDRMLDALMDEAEEGYAEASRRRGGRQRQQGVTTATGRSPYRPPAQSGYVSQAEFKEAMTRVGDETRRNAEGIKTVNTRLGKLDGRVDGVVTVATSHGRKIESLNNRMKLDGALDFAQSFTLVTTPGGGMGLQPDLSEVLRGVVKNGMIGDTKGAFANPWVIGILGLVLRNPAIIGGLLRPAAANP